MEYLFIDKPESVKWTEIVAINRKSSICLVLEGFRSYLNKSTIEKNNGEDIRHVGVGFYHPHAFQKLSLSALVWFFLRPSPLKRSNSWMAGLQVVVIKKGILEKVSVDEGYTNPHMVLADIAFQVVRNGGMVCYDPALIDFPFPENLKIVKKDLQRFVLRFFGRRACIIGFPFSLYSYFGKVKEIGPPYSVFNLIKAEKVKEIREYSAIIPTINRYDYLKKAIYSLLNNPRPPAEIVVVDQTPVQYRRVDYYSEFDPKIVRVFFLDKAGQSSSRNFAIKQVKHRWILLFEDDAEAWENTILEHIHLLEYSAADFSTGVALAPWKDVSYIPKTINFFHLASVLASGNCMCDKEWIDSVGLFDQAFDKGSGADDNLGKRLYLAGACIVFNPKAIETHHKAPKGGLRTYGAWWKNKGTYFGPFPLPTESYDFIRFYPRRFYIRLCLYRLFTSYRRSGPVMNIINTLLFPMKVFLSYRKAQTLLKTGLAS